MLHGATLAGDGQALDNGVVGDDPGRLLDRPSVLRVGVLESKSTLVNIGPEATAALKAAVLPGKTLVRVLCEAPSSSFGLEVPGVKEQA